MKTESFKCISEPYKYSFDLLEKSNKANITCICTVMNQMNARIIWDKEGFKTLREEQTTIKFEDINYSNLFK